MAGLGRTGYDLAVVASVDVTRTESVGVVALLPGERRLLATHQLGGVLDALAPAIDATSDAWASLRMARYELMAGRDHQAQARLSQLVVSSRDPTVLRACRALLGLAAGWAGRFDRGDLGLPAVVEAASSRDAPTGDVVAILELSAVAFGRLIVDGRGTGFTWAEQELLTNRLIAESEAWLDRAADATRFADGIDCALHGVGMAFLSEHSAWSASFAARLRRAATRYRLRAWIPIIDFYTAFALHHLGQFERAQTLTTRAIDWLRQEQGSPWLPFALASEVLVSTLTRGPDSVDLTALERELVVGAWRTARPLVAHTCIHRMAMSVADRGDPVGARAILAKAGALDRLHLINEDRAQAHEIVIAAALAQGDRQTALNTTRALGQLMASSTQQAVLARVYSMLDADRDAPADLVGPAAATGTAVEVIRARWLTLASAIATKNRPRALGELATLDTIAAAHRTTAVRIRAVEMFRQTPQDLVDALNQRQREIAALAAAGLTNREIATRLFLSVRTVEYYLGEALRALGLSRRSQLATAGLPMPAAEPSDARRSPQPMVKLTNRQGQIAALVTAGCTNTEIAETLAIDEKTVEKHVTAVLRAIGATSRTAIAAAFLSAKL